MIQGNAVLNKAGLHQADASGDLKIRLRAPRDTDGSRVWALIEATPALDSNSLYANLLQCSDFADTCTIAERDGEVVGWMSGYVPPAQPDTLFVWQVCVSDAARGQGLGKRLIADALARVGNAKLTQVSCTITGDNEASWALFGSVAKALNAQLQRAERFDRDSHFAGEHASEFAVSIGPIQRDRVASLAAA
ncbi:diaminobutyrate acetyltransferase [Devosia neptuniae]|jgi:L-2,4-diaminobutyric acid acetyltransferase|uniref:diaminobutyrate acetyltransferase n=1 Tax=Devosia neptuniae TaxID=191302 RepID=UPI0022AEC97A|nr:diaminobutyrate acetyltransferase [Devosia neptuniae]|tara:strand:- start:38053 stop:38628 length:576 start_codon:yes stop_codon:yes gene_type:complete